MNSRMLIDASHPEETRVVVQNNNAIIDFDFESATRRPLRGNIYLAKVTRVEPSLQAAFVDYGGNRHGFLALNEIHPDYYQIPLSDREALLREQQEEDRASAKNDAANDQSDEDVAGDQDTSEDTDDNGETSQTRVENVGGDAHEEASTAGRLRTSTRKYKIQEVIKRRQIILVQVVKEERGNKGAALTTYLSLAGRYCVLMPNTARGGGISRKINHASDRKKLKKIAESLDVPTGMGLIIRTAGAERTATEIKRDYSYLTKTWAEIRDLTLKSTAPALVYEEGTLIRRCIRDLYDKDFDEVVVDGEDAFQEARSYMKLLMPSHLRKVKQHKDTDSLYRLSGVEDQLTAMFNPVVTLPSGGYLVINQTEALVAVDVNSGKSTGEFSIEKTAVNTNLEAADEVARQMRLRDLAGLIVIDFIDMDEHRNNRLVEKRLKEALKSDRARIQVGRISAFGLLEMSRQRTRSGVLDSSSHTCKHCQGSGLIRSVESRTLHVLRALDARAGQNSQSEIMLALPADVAVYLLNQKRAALRELEEQHGCVISISIDDTLMAMEMQFGDNQSGPTRMDAAPEPDRRNADRNRRNRHNDRQNERQNERQSERQSDRREAKPQNDTASDEEEDAPSLEAPSTDNGMREQNAEEPRGRRRRRGRRGGRNRRQENVEHAASDATGSDATGSSVAEADLAAPDTQDRLTPISEPISEPVSNAPAEGDEPFEQSPTQPHEADLLADKKPRRRRKKAASPDASAASPDATAPSADDAAPHAADEPVVKAPKRPARSKRTKVSDAEPALEDAGDAKKSDTKKSSAKKSDAKKSDAKKSVAQETDEKPKRGRRKKVDPAEPAEINAVQEVAATINVAPATASAAPEKTPAAESVSQVSVPSASTSDTNAPTRKGWWRR